MAWLEILPAWLTKLEFQKIQIAWLGLSRKFYSLAWLKPIKFRLDPSLTRAKIDHRARPSNGKTSSSRVKTSRLVALPTPRSVKQWWRFFRISSFRYYIKFEFFRFHFFVMSLKNVLSRLTTLYLCAFNNILYGNGGCDLKNYIFQTLPSNRHEFFFQILL